MVMQTQKMNRKFLREIDSPFSFFLCHFNILFIFRVLSRLKGLIEDEKYEIIIDECSKIIESSPTEKYHIDLAKVLRGTFYILKKQHKEAMDDFHDLIVSVTFTRKRFFLFLFFLLKLFF